jgi:hypothetical protein
MIISTSRTSPDLSIENLELAFSWVMNFQALPRLVSIGVTMRTVKGVLICLRWNVIIHVMSELTRSDKNVLLP